MHTTIQIYANHVFKTPLPSSNNAKERCRECGGVIDGKGIEKKYSDAWAMEGYIFDNNKTVCPACDVATKGSQTKALLTPSNGMAVIIHKNGIIPKGLEKFEIKAKKAVLHEGCLTIKEAIRKIPELPIPYAIYSCVGNPTKVTNNFLKYVPVNYNLKISLMYLLPAMVTVKIDVDGIFDMVAEMKAKVEKEKDENPKGHDYYLFDKVYQNYHLSRHQQRFYWHLLKN